MTETQEMSVIERAARALAEAMGDDFDAAFASKPEWIDARGEKGGRFRDINEPRQSEYLEGVRAVLQAIREPSEAVADAGVDMLTERGCNPLSGDAEAIWQAMIDTALSE